MRSGYWWPRWMYVYTEYLLRSIWPEPPTYQRRSEVFEIQWRRKNGGESIVQSLNQYIVRNRHGRANNYPSNMCSTDQCSPLWFAAVLHVSRSLFLRDPAPDRVCAVTSKVFRDKQGIVGWDGFTLVRCTFDRTPQYPGQMQNEHHSRHNPLSPRSTHTTWPYPSAPRHWKPLNCLRFKRDISYSRASFKAITWYPP